MDKAALTSYLVILTRAKDMAAQIGGADAGANPTFALTLVVEGLVRQCLEDCEAVELVTAALDPDDPGAV